MSPIIHQRLAWFVFILALFASVTTIAAQSTIPVPPGGGGSAYCRMTDIRINGRLVIVESADDDLLQAVAVVKEHGSPHAWFTCFDIIPPLDLLEKWIENGVEENDIEILCLNDDGIFTQREVDMFIEIGADDLNISVKGTMRQHGACYLFFATTDIEAEVTFERIPLAANGIELAPGGIRGSSSP